MSNKHKDKTPLYVVMGLIGLFTLIISIVAIVDFNRNIDISGVVVDVTYPPENTAGGATTYKVTGAKSVRAANAAIIKNRYPGDEYFRAITDQELRNIVNIIALKGCGQITESYGATGPPVDNARNWIHYSNDNYDSIDVYVLDGKYRVIADCLP